MTGIDPWYARGSARLKAGIAIAAASPLKAVFTQAYARLMWTPEP